MNARQGSGAHDRAAAKNATGILGLGFMGTSLGLALRSKGSRVLGWDKSPVRGRKARALGAVNRLVRPSAAWGECDVVVLALPPSALLAQLPGLSRWLSPGALIMDLASVRKGLYQEGRRSLGPAARRWIGAHPMAGSEKSGPDLAKAGLFHGARVFLLPPPGVEKRALARARKFWKALSAFIEICDEKAHDRAMLRLSHGPHAVAAALVLALEGEPGWRKKVGPGFRDATRIAAGEPSLWAEILSRNGEGLDRYLAGVSGILRRLGLAARAGRDADLRRLLARASRSRRSLK